jgi:hypothetical protein
LEEGMRMQICRKTYSKWQHFNGLVVVRAG